MADDESIGVVTQFTCRQCGSPLGFVWVDWDTMEYVCPVHGSAGLFIDGGEMDLNLVRGQVGEGELKSFFVEEAE